jgi:hypothetical protein
LRAIIRVRKTCPDSANRGSCNILSPILTTPGNHLNSTVACLIIDDPLLRPRYGCLEYETILREMKEHHFFTEIAFIPWNYRRCDLKTIQLFLDNPEHFGICVHGCNHTFNEFGSTDYDELFNSSSIALWRMEKLKQLTGLPYDPVMVFPQGLFSSVAMLALQNCGYRAAINTSLQAIEVKSTPFTLDLQTFKTDYYGFPLFRRRYPKDRLAFIQDMAYGRPIIVVVHIGDFKKGYKMVTDLVDWINGLGNVIWRPLSYIVDRYCGASISVAHPKNINAKTNRNGVAVRRYASEFRDRFIESNTLLSRLYRMVWHDFSSVE